MSEQNRPKRSKPKQESGIHGKHYERKVLALTALKCLLDKNIKDFWLLSNPRDIDKFDDIILLTEFNNGEKKLFMIQVKHKLQGTNRPIIADKLDGSDGNLSLAMYQKAFCEIKDNKDFLETNDICDGTDMICILFNNCKVNREVRNDHIDFHLTCHNYLHFIDTSGNTGVLRINNKTGKYDQNFLDRFYFCTKQLNEDSIDNEIGNLLGVNSDTVQGLLNFFYSWVDPKHDCIKLTKLDIKIKLLDILLGDIQPPRDVNSVNDCKLVNVINKFNATVISKESSLVEVWNEIFHEIEHYCDGLIPTSTSWEQSIPPEQAEEKFPHFKDKETLLMGNKDVTIKFVYISLVIQGKIPFVIKTNNRLFNSFKNKLLQALDLYSVVYNVDNKCIDFHDITKVFQNLSDIEEKLYYQYSKQLMVSFQGKDDIDLYDLIKDNKIKEKFSVDNYIELIQKKCKIGEANMLPKYYINRKMRIPLVGQQVFDEKEFLFFIFQYPRKVKINSRGRIDLVHYIIKSFDEMYGESPYIITTPHRFDNNYIHLIEILSKDRVYFVFKFIKKGSFLLLHTNGSIEILKPYLNYTRRTDVNLCGITKDCGINIICNNAGMGKSTFLTFMNSKLSADEWVIHMDLKKYKDHIKTIQTVEELISFSCSCQNINICESSHTLFENLYQHLKHKVVWLIDDYEEVNQPILLELFKLASRQGFRIWIVARPLLKSEFENVFGVFSMELVEFNKKDQKMFTEKYLRQKNKSEEDIKKTMVAIGNIKHLLEDSFIGTCQQTMMLTEIFLDYESIWREQEWRIHDIYEKFINLKVSDNNGWYLRTLSKLAMKVFLKDEALKPVFDLEEFNEDVQMFKHNCRKDFFISEFTENDVPIFSHRTYAEFLAARWMSHTVKKQMKGETPFNISGIFQMLHLRELTAVRQFFDNMMTKYLPLHCAIVNKEDNQKALTEECFSKTDLIGRSVFHLVSSYGNYFDIGIPRGTTDLVRNLDIHSQVVQEGQYILLKPIESKQPNNSDGNIKGYLGKLNFLSSVNKILKEDALLKLNSIDYALLSGSLLELDVLLKLRNEFVNESALALHSDEMKYCILFHCIQNNFTNILSTLDVKGLINVKIDPTKGSLLHLAVTSKNLEAVKKLTHHHPLEEWGVDNLGNTPLHIACNQKDDSMLKYLSELVYNVDVGFLNRKNLNDESLLHLLVRRGHFKWIKKIIKVSSVSIDSEDHNGNTPFLFSVIFKKIRIASLLRSYGADVNHANNRQMTALHYAASKGFAVFVNKLLSWKTDVNAKDKYGKTPLMKASSWNHKDIVELLLVNKAKVNICDSNNWTALHHAVRRNNIEVIELLLQYNANTKCVNKKGETPLKIAVNHKFMMAMLLLLEATNKSLLTIYF